MMMRELALGLGLLVALGGIGCSPAEAGDEGEMAEGPGSVAARGVPEPDASELLIPPPPGSEYEEAASEVDEDGGTRSRDGYRSVKTWTYVYVTDLTLEEVVQHYVDAEEDSPHYVRMDDVFADYNTRELNIHEEEAAGPPPDQLEALIEQNRDQGHMTEAEAEEALADMARYRRIYPKIEGLVLSTVDFGIEEDHEGRDEFRLVDIELIRPYVDIAAAEVREGRVEIVYEVELMKRRSD